MNPQCFGVLHRKSPAIRDRLKHVDLSCEAFADTFVKLTTDIQTASHSTVGTACVEIEGRQTNPAVLDASFQQDICFGGSLDVKQTCIPVQVYAYTCDTCTTRIKVWASSFCHDNAKAGLSAGTTGSHYISGSTMMMCVGLVCKPMRSGSAVLSYPVARCMRTQSYVVRRFTRPTSVQVKIRDRELMVREMTNIYASRNIGSMLCALQTINSFSSSLVRVSASSVSQAAIRTVTTENPAIQLGIDSNAIYSYRLLETNRNSTWTTPRTYCRLIHDLAKDGSASALPRSIVHEKDYTRLGLLSVHTHQTLWVVTGGTGSLGDLASNWLADHTPGHICVTGRAGKVATRPAAIMTSRDGVWTLTRSDAGLVNETLHLQFGKLEGILHVSGALDDACLTNQTSGRVRKVFAPKLSGAENLHRFSAGLHSVEFTILFSSVTSQLGSGGQSNYSAANAALDQLADKEAHSGIPTVSVQWGAWDDVGMVARDEHAKRNLTRIGLVAMSPAESLDALGSVMGSSGVQTVCHFDWSQIVRSLTDRPYCLNFYGEYIQPMKTSSDDAKMPSMTLNKAYTKTESAVYEGVRSIVREIIGCDVGMQEPLMEAGLDSIVAIDLANTISEKFDLRLASTLAFDYPTIALIAVHVMSKMQVQTSVEQVKSRIEFPAEIWEVTQINIRSTAGYLSDMMTAPIHHDLVRAIPTERWDIDIIDGHLHEVRSRMGNIMPNVDRFDIEIFSVHASEATIIDPQHRVLIMESISVMNSNTEWISRNTTGVYVGTAWTEYNYHTITCRTPVNAYSATSAALSAAS
eukprot:29850-Pelagococcus_subviridis.AAC.1